MPPETLGTMSRSAFARKSPFSFQGAWVVNSLLLGFGHGGMQGIQTVLDVFYSLLVVRRVARNVFVRSQGERFHLRGPFMQLGRMIRQRVGIPDLHLLEEPYSRSHFAVR